jgi:hypothetical protein
VKELEANITRATKRSMRLTPSVRRQVIETREKIENMYSRLLLQCTSETSALF